MSNEKEKNAERRSKNQNENQSLGGRARNPQDARQSSRGPGGRNTKALLHGERTLGFGCCLGGDRVGKRPKCEENRVVCHVEAARIIKYKCRSFRKGKKLRGGQRGRVRTNSSCLAERNAGFKLFFVFFAETKE